MKLKTSTVRTVVISLCDNDFGSTFFNLLETIMRAIEYHKGSRDELQKEDIEKAIYEAIRFHYLTFQSLESLRENTSKLDYTLNYLQTNINVYFDDEAEKFISEHDHDGGSWYLETITGKVYYF